MRSRNVGEMVIRELIREYQMKIDTSMSATLGFSFAGKDLVEEIYNTASSWLKAVLLAAGGIFVYRNKDALEGLGTIAIEKAAAAAKGAVIKLLTRESRIISEATYDSRFEPNVKSEGLEEVAKKLVGMIKMDIHDLSETINIDDEDSINSSVTAFNNDAAKSMKMIVDLCTNSSRSYPSSLSTFKISAPPLPNDITEDEQKKIAGYLLLDVASIQLCSILYANIMTYYDKAKEELDKKYLPKDDMNETLTDKIESLLKTLSTNLYSIMSPARDILVKPK